MRFVPRIEWGAIKGDALSGLLTSMVTVHWGGSPSGNPKHDHCGAVVRSFQSYHIKTQGWADIAYNLVVCAHGYVFEGRGKGKRSAANGDAESNGASYAICYMGGAGEPFTAEAQVAINEAALYLVPSGPTWRVHSDWVDTGCPGAVITDWVRNGHPSTAPRPTPQEVPPLSPSAFRYVADGQDFVFDGPSQVFFATSTDAQLKFLDGLGVAEKGKVDGSVHGMFQAIAAAWSV